MGACARNMQSDPAEIKPAQCCITLVFSFDLYCDARKHKIRSQLSYFSLFPGAFAKFRKATLTFVMSVLPSVRMKNSSSTERFLMKFCIWGFFFFRKYTEKIRHSNTLYRASRIILYSDQQMHNYFTNYHTATRFDTIVSSSGSL